MAVITIKANRTEARASGTVASPDELIVVFPSQTKIVGFMAQASSGNTIKISYTLDLDASTVLWSDWAHGDADSSQVWAAAFEGGLHAFKVTGDGSYSYSWD